MTEKEGAVCNLKVQTKQEASRCPQMSKKQHTELPKAVFKEWTAHPHRPSQIGWVS